MPTIHARPPEPIIASHAPLSSRTQQQAAGGVHSAAATDRCDQPARRRGPARPLRPRSRSDTIRQALLVREVDIRVQGVRR
jgi:hypothetical protein